MILRDVLFCFFVLFSVNTICFAQREKIERIEIFAVFNDPNNVGPYTLPRNELRKVKAGGRFYKGKITKKECIEKIVKYIPDLKKCDFYGIIYPHILLDIYYQSGERDEIVFDFSQRIEFKKKVYKPEKSFYKEVLEILPSRFRKKIKYIDPESC